MDQSTSSQPKSKGPLALGVLGGVAVLGLVAKVMMQNDQPSAPVTEPAPAPSTDTAGSVPTPAVPVTGSATYKDGTYTADGSYMTHAGGESVKITVTLQNNVITDSQFQGTPNLPMSQKFMDMFANNYKGMVVGKNIAEVKLGKVSGSSLTPMGFNEALAKIKQQAQVQS